MIIRLFYLYKCRALNGKIPKTSFSVLNVLVKFEYSVHMSDIIIKE